MSAQNPSGTGIDTFRDPYSYADYDGIFGRQYVYDSQETANVLYGDSYVSSGDTFWDKLNDFFTGTDTKAAYENWKTQRDRDYERQATLSARAYDTWKENTRYQRMVQDLKKAGLNPWLALQSGISGGQGTATAGSGSSARSHTNGSSKQSNLTGVAMLLMSVAKIISVIG